MSEIEVAALAREAVWVLLKLATPLLLTALVVGTAVSLLQALIQVNEATLIFVPKLLAIAVVLLLLVSFFLQTLSDYTATLFDRVVAVGTRA